MCQKYKRKKDEADEVAELDCRNIITAGVTPLVCL